MALVVGVNSYISRADANTYFEDSLRFSSWDGLTDENKDRALVTASLQLNNFVIQQYRLPIAPADIPDNLANGTAELGLTMALDPNVVTQNNTGSNIKILQAGTARLEFFNPTSESSSRFPQFIQEILGDCLASTSALAGSIAVPFVSGTTGDNSESSFTDRNKFGYTEGL